MFLATNIALKSVEKTKFCSGLEKLDSRLSQNYSSEIGDHNEKESQLQTATKSSGRSASLERYKKRRPSLSRPQY